MKGRGQVLIVVAVLIPILLLLLAVVVDGGRLYIARARLQRSAQSAADAGISVVAEQMVTLAVARQTSMASTRSPTPPGTMTATPLPSDLQAWLTDDDRRTLASDPLRGTAVAEALSYASRNGFDAANPEIIRLEVQFPQTGYDADDPAIEALRIMVTIERKTTVLLAGLLGEQFINLLVDGQSEIPQR